MLVVDTSFKKTNNRNKELDLVITRISQYWEKGQG